MLASITMRHVPRTSHTETLICALGIIFHQPRSHLAEISYLGGPRDPCEVAISFDQMNVLETR